MSEDNTPSPDDAPPLRSSQLYGRKILSIKYWELIMVSAYYFQKNCAPTNKKFIVTLNFVDVNYILDIWNVRSLVIGARRICTSCSMR